MLARNADDVLLELSTRQFVRPHTQLANALTDAAEKLGFCPSVADKAMTWLELDPTAAIGRVTRTQLSQLARSIHRFSRQSREEAARPPTAEVESAITTRAGAGSGLRGGAEGEGTPGLQ
jgi:hypothetical protein